MIADVKVHKPSFHLPFPSIRTMFFKIIDDRILLGIPIQWLYRSGLIPLDQYRCEWSELHSYSIKKWKRMYNCISVWIEIFFSFVLYNHWNVNSMLYYPIWNPINYKIVLCNLCFVWIWIHIVIWSYITVKFTKKQGVVFSSFF